MAKCRDQTRGKDAVNLPKTKIVNSIQNDVNIVNAYTTQKAQRHNDMIESKLLCIIVFRLTIDFLAF